MVAVAKARPVSTPVVAPALAKASAAVSLVSLIFPRVIGC